MGHRNRPALPPTKWAYGYEISPPVTAERLKAIEAMLEKEQAAANRETRTWQGRFVVQERVTHILVVCDSPDQGLEINHRLEEELTRLEAVYLLTAPVALDDMGPLGF
jgi:hypothetical protein